MEIQQLSRLIIHKCTIIQWIEMCNILTFSTSAGSMKISRKGQFKEVVLVFKDEVVSVDTAISIVSFLAVPRI